MPNTETILSETKFTNQKSDLVDIRYNIPHNETMSSMSLLNTNDQKKLQLGFLFEINFKLFLNDLKTSSVLCISRSHQIISSNEPSLTRELGEFLYSKFWILRMYISFMVFLHFAMKISGISLVLSPYILPELVYHCVSIVIVYLAIIFYEKLDRSKDLFMRTESTNRVNNVMKSFLGPVDFTFKEDVRESKSRKPYYEIVAERSIDKTGMSAIANVSGGIREPNSHGHSWFKLPISRSRNVQVATSQVKQGLHPVDTSSSEVSGAHHEKSGAIYSITKFLTGKRSKSFTNKSHSASSKQLQSSLFGHARVPSSESHPPDVDNVSIVSSDEEDVQEVEIELDEDGNAGWKTLDSALSSDGVKKPSLAPSRGSMALRRGHTSDKPAQSQSTPTTPYRGSMRRSNSDPSMNSQVKKLLEKPSIRSVERLGSGDKEPPLSSKHRLYFPATPFDSDAFFNYSPEMSPAARNLFKDRAHCHSFKLRGASYLQDSEKVDPGPPLFKLMLMELYEVEPKDGDRHDHVVSRGAAKERVDELHKLPGCPFVFVVNFQIPGDPPVSLTNYFCVPPDVRERYAGEGTEQALALFEEFIRIPATEEERLRAWGLASGSEDSGENESTVSGVPHPAQQSGGGGGGIWGMKMPSDVTMPDGTLPGELPLSDFRNVHFKMIPLVTEGPWVVKTAIPSKPVILGKKLAVRYFSGPGYFEVDVHVGSSSIAANVTGFARGYSKAFAADMGIVLQGETPEELPERLLALAHVNKVDVNVRRLLD